MSTSLAQLEFAAELQRPLKEIERLLAQIPGGYVLTLIARNESNHDAHVLMTHEADIGKALDVALKLDSDKTTVVTEGNGRR